MATKRSSLSQIKHINILTPVKQKPVVNKKFTPTAHQESKLQANSFSVSTSPVQVTEASTAKKKANSVKQLKTPGSASSFDSQEENKIIKRKRGTRGRSRTMEHQENATTNDYSAVTPTAAGAAELPASTGPPEDTVAGTASQSTSSKLSEENASPSRHSFLPMSSPESETGPPSVSFNNTDDSDFSPASLTPVGSKRGDTDPGLPTMDAQSLAARDADAAAGLSPERLNELQREKRVLLRERDRLKNRMAEVEQRILHIDNVVSQANSVDQVFNVDYEVTFETNEGTSEKQSTDSASKSPVSSQPPVGIYWSHEDGGDLQIPDISSFNEEDDENHDDNDGDDDENKNDGSDDSGSSYEEPDLGSSSDAERNDDDDDSTQEQTERISNHLEQLQRELQDLKQRHWTMQESPTSSPSAQQRSSIMSGEEEEHTRDSDSTGSQGDTNTDQPSIDSSRGSKAAEEIDFIANTVNLKYVRQQGLEPVLLGSDEFARAKSALRRERAQAFRRHLREVSVDDDLFDDQNVETETSEARTDENTLHYPGDDDVQVENISAKEAGHIFRADTPSVADNVDSNETHENELKQPTTRRTHVGDSPDNLSASGDEVDTDFAANTVNLKYVKQQGLEPVLLNTVDFSRERQLLRKELAQAVQTHLKEATDDVVCKSPGEEVNTSKSEMDAAELMRAAAREAQRVNSENNKSPLKDVNNDTDSSWKLFQSEAIKSMNGKGSEANQSDTSGSNKESTPSAIASKLVSMGFSTKLADEAADRESNFVKALEWVIREHKRRSTDEGDEASIPESSLDDKQDSETSIDKGSSPKSIDAAAREKVFKKLTPVIQTRARAAAATRRQAASNGTGQDQKNVDNSHSSSTAPILPQPAFEEQPKGEQLPVAQDQSELDQQEKTADETLAAAQAAARALQRQREKASNLRRRADEHKVRGNDLYRRGQYSAAVEAYTQAVDLVGDNQIYWANRAAAKMMLFEYEGAIDDCMQAMSLPMPPAKPFYVKPYIRSGRAHLALGRAEAAREQFETALQEIAAVKAHRKSGITAGDVLDDEESARKGIDHCRKYRQYCRTASLKLKMKEFHAGLENARDALAIASGSWEARCLVASAYITIRQFARCAEFCESYLPESWVAVGQARQNSTRPSSSRVHNESGRRDADAELGIRYAKALHYQGYYCQAMDVLREVIRDVTSAQPNKASGVSAARTELMKMESMMRRHDAGNRFYRNEHYDEAFREYSTALQLDPLNNAYCAVVYANRAAAALALKRYERAIKDCTESLRRRPNMSKAQYRRARAYVHMKEYSKAIADFEEVQKSELACNDIGRELREAQLLLDNERRERLRQAQAKKTAARLAEERRRKWEHDRREREKRERQKREREKRDREKREREKREREKEQKRKQEQAKTNPYAKYAYGNSRYTSRGTKQSTYNAYGQKQKRQQSSYGYNARRHQTNGPAPTNSKQQNRPTNNTQTGANGNKAGAAPHRDVRGPRKTDDFYQVLGLTRRCTSKQIKKAYHKLALKFHPDKNAGSPRTASEKFKLVNEAYSTLSDEAQRKKYDNKLRYGFEF